MKYILALFGLSTLLGFAKSASSSSFLVPAESAYSADTTYYGDAQLSYTIAGRTVNIKSNYHTGNKNSLAIFINQVAKKPGGMVSINLTNYITKEVVNLQVSDKGTSHIQHYSPTLFNRNAKQAIFMLKYNNYYADDVTVQIISIDAKHVSGTFSGFFISDNKIKIQITNGSFDVPYKD